jgi:hypothetical protein
MMLKRPGGDHFLRYAATPIPANPISSIAQVRKNACEFARSKSLVNQTHSRF